MCGPAENKLAAALSGANEARNSPVANWESADVVSVPMPGTAAR